MFHLFTLDLWPHFYQIFFLDLFNVCEDFTHVYICTPVYAWCPRRSERASDLLGLELHMVVRSIWVLGDTFKSFIENALNH